jgi:dihydrofolate synthase / folylpolyglutamate synthase
MAHTYLTQQMTQRRVLGIRPGLDRIKAVLEYLGNPQRSLGRVALIAGTNGKGSTASFVYSMLRAAGFRCALYTSPHLVAVDERIQLDGRSLPEEELKGALAAVVHAEHATGQKLTGFELLTAVAFRSFAAAKPDYTVLEVGLGGRLDATNVVEPAVSTVTPIGLDHCDFLGHTLSAIAMEKAGIFRSGTPAVVATGAPDVVDTLRQQAEAKTAPLHLEGAHFDGQLEGDLFTYAGPGRTLSKTPLGLAGAYQGQNAALAVATVDLLTQSRLEKEILSRGLADARWPGRFDLRYPGGTPVLFDGAHNREGIAALSIAFAARWPGKTDILLVVRDNRNIEDIVGPLLPLARRIIATEARGAGCHPPQQVVSAAPPGIEGIAADSSESALTMLLREPPSPSGIPKLCCGSLYLVGYCFESLRLNAQE